MSDKAKKFDGIERRHEISQSSRREDTRSVFRKFGDSFEDPDKVFTWYFIIGIFTIFPLSVIPFVPEIIFLIMLIVTIVKLSFKNRRWKAPFRVPRYLGIKGFKDSSTGSYGEGDILLGIGLGEDLGKEVWASNSDIRTHRFVVGTTGSGKTEEIFGSLFNSLLQQSGFIMVDGKASPSTFDRILTMKRMFGREENLFLLNYIMGGKDHLGYSDTKISHTYNPLALGSATTKTELMNSLLAGGEGGGDDFWKQQAENLMKSLISALTFLSQKNYIILSPQVLSHYLNLENIENLIFFGIFLDTHGKVVDLLNHHPNQYAQMQKWIQPMVLVVENLPGYAECRPTKPAPFIATNDQEVRAAIEGGEAAIVAWAKNRAAGFTKREQEASGNSKSAGEGRSEVYKQWGYMTMQLVSSISNMTYSYGHIFNDQIGEIDFKDIFLNRRSLFVLLPSLERNPSSMAMFGKLVVSAQKAVLGSQIDTPFEGERRFILEGRPSTSPVPYNITFDEYAYYVTTGGSVAAAQGREFGVSMTYATQALDGIMKKDPHEGGQTWDNTNLRLAGRITGGMDTETWQKLSGAAGDGQTKMLVDTEYVHKQALDNFTPKGELRIESGSRISFNDLNSQQNGDFHLIVGMQDDVKNGYSMSGNVRVVRYKAFYTGNITPIKDFRLTHFCQMKPPSMEYVQRLKAQKKQNNFLDTAAALTALELFLETTDNIAVENKETLLKDDYIGRLLRLDSSLDKSVIYSELKNLNTLAQQESLTSTISKPVQTIMNNYMGMSKYYSNNNDETQLCENFMTGFLQKTIEDYRETWLKTTSVKEKLETIKPKILAKKAS